jgi:hypothetical protein
VYQSLPFADRRQRRDTRPHRLTSRTVRTGEKDYFDPANPADMQELRTVLNYSRR